MEFYQLQRFHVPSGQWLDHCAVAESREAAFSMLTLWERVEPQAKFRWVKR